MIGIDKQISKECITFVTSTTYSDNKHTIFVIHYVHFSDVFDDKFGYQIHSNIEISLAIPLYCNFFSTRMKYKKS